MHFAAKTAAVVVVKFEFQSNENLRSCQILKLKYSFAYVAPNIILSINLQKN
jgi:hypothetical protein